jgi:P4 family phage/plasmid primase-like protien
MNAVAETFRDVMQRAGLVYMGPIAADGRLHRFKASGDRARNSWFVLHDGTPAAGAFGCWKRQTKETWCDRDSTQLSIAEREAVRRRLRESEAERERVEKLRRRKARKIADWILSRSTAADRSHGYLVAKRVQPHGELCQWRGQLVVPLRDADGVLHSVQRIGIDSSKRFLTGGRIQGCMFTIADAGTGPLVIAEGYATGASIHESNGMATISAMNCGNLLAVGKALRAKYPNRDIIIAADNDAFITDKDGKPKNPGVIAAKEAAKAIHARLAVPQFKGTGTKPTDFNDLANHEGPDKVKTQIEAATSPPESEHAYQPALGQDGRTSLTPSQWFARKFPSILAEYGDPILEEIDKRNIVLVRDIGEDFFAAALGDKGRPDAPTVFVPTEEKFFTYSPRDGVFVLQREPVLLTVLSRQLLECARACRGAECDTTTLEFRFRDTANLTGVLRKARGLLAVPHDYFSTELTEFIQCANGMLRLRDKVLLPFSPSYRRRNKLAVPYDPAAKCPLFLDTLMHPALEPEDFDLVQRHSGLMLIGENVAQRIMLLTGTPGGGKGTYIRVVCGVIGQVNLASLRPQLLGERFELGRFLGKTLLYGADVPDNFLNQRGASILKSLTGGDPVTLEFKNSNESPFIICKFNVIATCNSRLTVHLEGDTDAWRRRLAIADYHKPRPPKVIADLDELILAQEGSGVLNFMLEGLDKLRADDWQLHLTSGQQAVVDNLLLESDGHTVFARECLKRQDGANLTVPDCFAAYVEFCTQRGWTALTKNKFGALIGDVVVRQFGLTTSHDIRDANGKSQRGWRGIALARKLAQSTDKIASEVSETHPSDESDAFFPFQPKKKETSPEPHPRPEPALDEEDVP